MFESEGVGVSLSQFLSLKYLGGGDGVRDLKSVLFGGLYSQI